MADLLANQTKTKTVSRGMEIEGEVIAIQPQEIIFDLGTKAEGVLPKKSLSEEVLSNLKIGDKLTTFVMSAENESGQVVLGTTRLVPKGKLGPNRFARFEDALKNKQILSGKGLELNKGGLIVEVQGVRGFLPISQLSLSQMNNPEELIGKDIQLTIIEIDSAQNRLIFSQKTTVSEDTKKLLSEIQAESKVKGKIEAVLSFGLFVRLENGLEGLVHISEVSWDKVEDLQSLFKEGQEVECSVLSLDFDQGRVNLSLKQLSTDPFNEIAGKFQVDDVVKGVIAKVTQNGVAVTLKHSSVEGEIEGTIPTAKLDPDTQYVPGNPITVIIDSIDLPKRRITLAPFVTSTKDLIYK